MITNGAIASLYFVLARTDPVAGVRTGATMFAVPACMLGPADRAAVRQARAARLAAVGRVVHRMPGLS